MRKEQLEQLKNAKIFKPADIIPYALLAVLIFALFLGFVILKPTTALESVKVYIDDKSGEKLVLSYDFESEKLNISIDFLDFVKIEEKEDGKYLTIYQADKTSFNTIKIAKDKRVSVVEANCSYHKDCVTFSPITKGSEIIICVPHHLQIIGNGEQGEPDDPILG